MAKISELDILSKDVDHTIANLKGWMKDVIIDTPVSLAPGRSKIVYEPLGVALVLSPWNFPISLAI